MPARAPSARGVFRQSDVPVPIAPPHRETLQTPIASPGMQTSLSARRIPSPPPSTLANASHRPFARRASFQSARLCDSAPFAPRQHARSEEHTSELQSQSNLVCRLLLEKKKKK